MGIFICILFGTLWAFWTWMSVSSPRLGKFSAIQISILPLSLSFLLKSYSTLSYTINLLSYGHFFVLFSFDCPVWVSPNVSSSSLVIHSSVSSSWPSCVFLSSVIVFFSSLTSYILYLFVKLFTVFMLLLHSVSNFMTITLNSL